MNWGVKIAVFYIGFVIMVLASVFFAMNQKNDLVTENYYEKELTHQEQIDKSQRTKSLKQKTEIQLTDKQVKIKFPILPEKNEEKNIILFYRPSDRLKDLRIPVSTDSLGVQYVPTEKLSSGFWKIKLNWLSHKEEYYDESIINIP